MLQLCNTSLQLSLCLLFKKTKTKQKIQDKKPFVSQMLDQIRFRAVIIRENKF